MKTVIGIDPGLKGGFASISDDGTVEAFPMPVAGGVIAGRAIGIWVARKQLDGSVIAVVEKVHSMPKQGVASTFTFGMGFGKVLGVLEALGVPLFLVSPQSWKKSVLRDTPGDKAAAVAFCTQRWPDVELVPAGCRVPNDGMADALCIAEYGRRAFT